MNNPNQTDHVPQKKGLTLLAALSILVLLFITSRINYLIFHTLSEFFAITVAWALFIVLWNTRTIIENKALIFIGIAYLFIGAIDLMHTLSYKGMGVLGPETGANPATQLWILARYTESISLCVFPLIFNKRIQIFKIFCAYGLVVGLGLASIFYWQNFPLCYIEGQGLTMFKVYSEYAICLILLIALLLLKRQKQHLDKLVNTYMTIAIILTIVGELAFTFYVSVYGLSNLFGHFIKIISFYFIYLALIQSGLRRPLSILFAKTNENDERLNTALEAVSDAVWDWRINTGDVAFNAGWYKILGYDPYELPQSYDTWMTLLHPDDREHAENMVASHIESGALFSMEFRMRTKLGNWKWLLGRGKVVEKDEAGTPIRMIGTNVDIANKKELEKQIVKAKEELERTLEATTDGIWTWDFKKDKLSFSPRYYTMLGYEPNEFPANYENWLGLLHSDDKEKVLQVANQFLKTKSDTYENEFRLKAKDGTYRWVRATGKVVEKTDNGDPVLMIGNHEDITEKKLALESLIEEKERFNLAMKCVNDGLWDWDLETNGIYYSPVWKQLLGYQDHEIKNDFSEWERLTDSKDVKRAWNILDSAIKGDKKKFEAEFKMKHKKGHCVDILSRADIIRDDQGKPVRVVGTHVDITERKDAERVLKESERKYRELFESSLDGIIRTDLHGVINEVNPTFLKMVGYDHINDLAKTYQALTPEKWHGYEADIVKNQILKKGYSDEYEKEYVHKDGSIFPVSIKVWLVKEQGNPVGMWGIVRDISERKEAEKQILKSEDKFKGVFQYANIGIALGNEQGDLIDVNKEFEDLVGYPREELLQMDYSKLTHPDDLIKEQGLMDQMVKGKIDNYRIEKRYIRKNGEVRWVDLSVTSRSNIDKTIDMFIGMAIDITNQKRSERQIQEEKETAERYLNLAGVIFVAINEKGEVTLINKKGCEVLGYDYKEIIGKNWFENFIPKSIKDDLIPVSKMLLRGEIQPVEYYENTILTRSGEERLIAWHNTLLKDNENNITGHLSSGEDITEKKRMEEQLQQAQKMESIGNLAGGIAHDFNNILFPIIGMSELLLEDLPSDSPERENAEEILLAGKRGGELVKQILAFSRQSEHKMTPTRIQNILKEVLQLSRSSIPTYIEIDQDIKQNCGMIMADPTQIHQVCMNIITNAYHAVEKKGGKISVTLKETFTDSMESSELNIRSSNYAVLSISDNGHGMPESLIRKIFDPYFTTKERGKGTGLGLAVAYGIVKEHKGVIKVDSKVGKGTTFDIYLPLMKKRARYESQKESVELIGGNEHILLVDDERPIINLGRQMLERMGYKVTTRLNSVDALETFKSDPELYDLMITDMAMPNMTGDQLSHEIRSIRNDIPIIICTGFSEIIDEEKAKEIGINGFLMKPLVKSEMIKMVREILDAQ